MPKAQLAKWGNSLAIRIPRTVAERARMQAGDTVEIEALKDRVELRRLEKVPTLEDLVAQITPENRSTETATGEDQGKETVEW
jgi:antitoxin MazE